MRFRIIKGRNLIVTGNIDIEEHGGVQTGWKGTIGYGEVSLRHM